MRENSDLMADITHGNEADAVLQNAAFKCAFETLKKQIYEQIEDCPIRDKEGMFLLVTLLKTANKFESLLSGSVESGKVAQIKLDQLRSESGVTKLLRKLA